MTELPEIIYRHIPERNCTIVFRIERDNKGNIAKRSYPLFDIDWGVEETPDLIAEIIRRCKEYNPWIPVSERLPKDKGYIVVIAVADAKLKIPQTWYWTNTNVEAKRLNAFCTHWKPIILPEQALAEDKK